MWEIDTKVHGIMTQNIAVCIYVTAEA